MTQERRDRSIVSISKEAIERVLRSEAERSSQQLEAFEESVWSGAPLNHLSRKQAEIEKNNLKLIERIAEQIKTETGVQIDLFPQDSRDNG